MRKIAFVLLCGTAAVSLARAEGAAPQIPQFTEETKAAGIDSVYSGEWEYMAGGGVATFDCNGDGFPDMLLAGGAAPAKFYRNESKRGGELHFVADKSGLELDHVTGAYPLDVDGDGNMDLVLLRVGENVVMRGLGACHFERANEQWGFAGGDAWSTAFSAMWEKGANWPTIAVGNYIDRTRDTDPWGSCTDNWLQRPDGQNKKFAAPAALKPSFCALSMLFTDWNRSGTPSLRISNDREYYEGGQEQLWHMEAGMEPKLYTDADGWKLLRIWGMGIAETDVDGAPAYYMTSMADNRLQVLASYTPGEAPKPTYKEAAFQKGITAHRPYEGDDLKPSTAWHAQFEDVNNDGLDDLFIAKGNVAKMPDFAAKDPNNLLLRQADGKFVEVGGRAGVDSMASSRGAQVADLNLDGLPDLVVVNRWENAQVWRNISANAGHFVEVKLQQEGANRDAIGSWIEVTHDGAVTRRELTVGGGHVSGSMGFVHLGLGDAKDAEIRIQWPGGEWSAPYKIEADKFAVIDKGMPGVSYWSPR